MVDRTKLSFYGVDPIDKIVCMVTGSFTVGGHAQVTDSPVHTLPFTPLMDCTWSTSPDFTLSYDAGSGKVPTIGGPPYDYSLDIAADGTDVIATGTNNTGSSVTMYYRAFGVEPSNSAGTVPYTSSLADKFEFYTAYNYTKLMHEDRVTSHTVYNHNLGRRPKVNVWEETIATGIIRKKNETLVYDATSSRVSVSTTDVDVSVASGTAIHYRVYYDG
jgi:hypothetical protein